ncbi:MAG: hypothetical protein R3F46_01625 [bacterium]
MSNSQENLNGNLENEQHYSSYFAEMWTAVQEWHQRNPNKQAMVDDLLEAMADTIERMLADGRLDRHSEYLTIEQLCLIIEESKWW